MISRTGPRTTRAAGGEPGADGHVAVARDQRGDSGSSGVEAGRQVDVEIGDDGGVARRPRGPQGPAPALLVQVDGADPGERVGQGRGFLPGAVGAGVVGDGDPGGEGEFAVHEVVQGPDAGLELGRLVVDRDHDVDVGGGRRPRGRQGGKARSRSWRPWCAPPSGDRLDAGCEAAVNPGRAPRPGGGAWPRRIGPTATSLNEAAHRTRAGTAGSGMPPPPGRARGRPGG